MGTLPARRRAERQPCTQSGIAGPGTWQIDRVMNKTFIKTLVAMAAAPVVAPGFADAACDYSRNRAVSACERVTRVAHDGTWDLYLTGYGWHIDGYDNTSHLNANSWRGGAGKHWTDENGNDDILFAMAFSDSHNHIEPIAGYARQWFTRRVDTIRTDAPSLPDSLTMDAA
ncbi:hypothetical protein [Caballeronia glathei]|nr:hypothetical protein [Caballeronia glathei]